VYFLYILQSESTGRYYVGQSQEVTERLAYHNANYSRCICDSFENQISSSDSPVNRFRYTGRQWHPETSLYYHRAK
jgi:hypothetical protein